MNALFAYKNLNWFWKPKDEYFWKLCKLSVDMASKYHKTFFYSDIETYQLFKSKNILFDEFIDCTELFSEINEHTYGMTKILTMINQTEPYVILDLDTILFSKIETTKQVCYGHYEINLEKNKPILDTLNDVNYLKTYYDYPYSQYIQNSELNLELELVDWIKFASNSLLVVNSPKVISEIYKEIVTKFQKEFKVVPPTYTVQFYEQFLLYNMLKKYDIDIEFLYDSPPGVDINKENIDLKEIYSCKYIHLDRYNSDETTKKIIDMLSFNKIIL
jgi:hypothetical protein